MIHCALSPYPAAVTMDDALHGGQTNPGALKLDHSVQALKWSKQFIGISHIKTGSVFPDVKGRGSVFRDIAKFNFGLVFSSLSRRACSACFRSVMSSEIPNRNCGLPSFSKSGSFFVYLEYPINCSPALLKSTNLRKQPHL